MEANIRYSVTIYKQLLLRTPVMTTLCDSYDSALKYANKVINERTKENKSETFCLKRTFNPHSKEVMYMRLYPRGYETFSTHIYISQVDVNVVLNNEDLASEGLLDESNIILV